MHEGLPKFQRRLVAWQRRHGSARLVAVATVLAVLSSGAISYLAIFLVYGFGESFRDVPGAMLVLPFAIPALVAPLLTSQLATTIAGTSQLVDELSIARTKLEDEVAARQEIQLELERLALHDPLTGLLNRRGFFDALAQLSSEQRGRLVIATVDVDNFKVINDTLGHAAGDRVLQAVAERLSTAAGTAALVARLGGDEFAAAIFDDAGGREICGVLCAFELDVAGQRLEVASSVGVARHAPGADIDETLAVADRELYLEKARRAEQRRAEQRHAEQGRDGSTTPRETLDEGNGRMLRSPAGA